MPSRRLLLPALAALAAAVLASTPAAAEAARPRHPPIVMLMFDAFETSMLFDAAGHIDPVRYPHIAALARTSTVYRRFTSPGDRTPGLTGSMLASKPYRIRAKADLRDYPKNLFTIFRRAGYRLNVREAASALCIACPGNSPDTTAQQVLSSLAHGRLARFHAWVRQIRSARHPTLFYNHLLLPHGPLAFSPSGHRYTLGPGEMIDGLNAEPSFGDPWLVRQSEQRYLMHVELVDTLVGELIARLKRQGLWDRAVFVLTSDNGEGRGHVGSDPHRIDGRTAAETIQTPLLFKLPGQRRGGYTDKRVRTIDLLPTLGRLAHVGVGRVAGRPFLGKGANRIPAGPIRAVDGDGRVFSFTPAGFGRAIAASIRHRVAIFGEHTRDLFHIGPSPGLLGKAVGALKLAAAAHYRASVHPASALRHVSFRHQLVPSQIVGTLRGPKVRRGLPFALALNGRIAATGRTARLRGSKTIWLSAMVPESSLKPGANQVRWFLVRGGRLLRVKRG